MGCLVAFLGLEEPGIEEVKRLQDRSWALESGTGARALDSCDKSLVLTRLDTCSEVA